MLKYRRVMNMHKNFQFGAIISKLENFINNPNHLAPDNKPWTRHKLHKFSTVRYSIICNLCKNKTSTRLDLDTICKLCYTLKCEIQDLIEYQAS